MAAEITKSLFRFRAHLRQNCVQPLPVDDGLIEPLPNFDTRRGPERAHRGEINPVRPPMQERRDLAKVEAQALFGHGGHRAEAGEAKPLEPPEHGLILGPQPVYGGVS